MQTTFAKTKRPRDWDDNDGPALANHQSTIHSFFRKTSRARKPVVSTKNRIESQMSVMNPHNSRNNNKTIEANQNSSGAHQQPVHDDPLQLAARSLNTNNHKKKKQTKLQQLYLDLGQSSFGKQTVCQICGMLYVHGVAEDAKEHEKICRDYRDGVSFHMKLSSCRVVAEYDSPLSGRDEGETERACILEVRPFDSYALRQKVKQVTAIVDKELGHVDESTCRSQHENKKPSSKPATTPKTIFLYILKKRVVGMVSVEVVNQGYKLLMREDGQQQTRSTQPSRAMIGIHKLWVHSKVRKQKTASRLVDTARARMVFGTVVPPQFVAFSSPTEAGARFAQSYLQHECVSTAQDACVLVYDLQL